MIVMMKAVLKWARALSLIPVRTPTASHGRWYLFEGATRDVLVAVSRKSKEACRATYSCWDLRAA
jgi:hypothetical protein